MKMRRMLRGFFTLILSCATLTGCGEVQNGSQLMSGSPQNAFEWQTNLTIRSFDGTALKAQLMVPNPSLFPGLRPAIIFVNSWTLNEFEYTAQALRLVKKGYIVLSYATRGFGGSGGVVSAASPNDIRDVSHMIDWLAENTAVDLNRIGMSGVSYGAGISLLALGNDPRIATVVALSGWADLEQALYGNETIRKVWIEVLIGSGAVTGRLDPEFIQIYQGVRAQRNMDYFTSWAKERSAIHLINQINDRQAPVFVANNYHDQLFPPKQMHRFFSALTGPKKFAINQGIHATAELPGLLGLSSRVWDDAIRWFDYWFYGEDNGIMDEDAISLEHDGKLEFHAELPDSRQTADIPMNPLNKLARPSGSLMPGVTGIVPVNGSKDSGATTGVPIISSLVDAHTPLNIQKKIAFIEQKHAAVYQSEVLTRDLRLRGTPRLEAWVRPQNPNAQLMAYLYEVDWRGWGVLLTHGAMTIRRVSPGEPVQLDFDLNTLAADVKQGNRLVLAIDSFDPLYEPLAASSRSFDLLHGPELRTRLYLPILQPADL